MAAALTALFFGPLRMRSGTMSGGGALSLKTLRPSLSSHIHCAEASTGRAQARATKAMRAAFMRFSVARRLGGAFSRILPRCALAPAAACEIARGYNPFFGAFRMRLLGKALTFDDVLLVPAFSQVLPKDTSLATRFSRNIQLNLPLVSAAMDTVTEARLAIAIAQEGGIGIVHKNLTAQQQAAEVARVKRYESGVLRDPVVITPQHTVRQVVAMQEQLGISGFPVIDAGKVVGIVTGRDLRFETRYDVPVSQIMTPRDKLIRVKEGTSPAEAKALLNKHRLERLLVLNDVSELKGLITVKDITKQTSFPNAARDASGRLRV